MSARDLWKLVMSLRVKERRIVRISSSVRTLRVIIQAVSQTFF